MHWLAQFLIGVSALVGSLFGFGHNSAHTPTAATSSPVHQESTVATPSKTLYSINADQVWFNDFFKGSHVITEASTSTFDVLTPAIGFDCAEPAYARDATHVFLDDTVLADADPATFRVVGYPYAEDATHVYNAGDVLASADPSTFAVASSSGSQTCAGTTYNEAHDATHFFIGAKQSTIDPNTYVSLNRSFSKDTNHVYTDQNTVLAGADPATLIAIGQYAGRDKHGIWWHTYNGFESSYDLLPKSQVDPATFAVFDSYAKDKSHVFDIAFGRLTLIEGADPATFAPINSTFYNDANHIYMDYAFPGCKDGSGIPQFYVIPAADPKTFVPLTPPYSKDATHVFYGSSVIAGAHITTFSQIRYMLPTYENSITTELARDTTSLYVRGIRVDGFDAQGSLTATSSYIWSNQSVGYLTEGDGCNHYVDSVVLVPGADTATFHVIKDGYAADATHIYFDGKKIVGADPASFTILNTYGPGPALAKDQNNLFADGKRSTQGAGLDLKTLVAYGYFIKDNNKVYYLYSVYSGSSPTFSLVLIPLADPATFHVLPSPTSDQYSQYAIDAHHVFRDNIIVADADPATFTILKSAYGDYYSKDVGHAYYNGTLIPGADASTFTVDPSNGIRAHDKSYIYVNGARSSPVTPN